MSIDLAADEVRVVVADDDGDVAQSLAEVLTLDGYTVFVACDGVAALALVERVQPHCVLVDVCMPHLNGAEFVRRVREIHRDNIVLIAITGFPKNHPDVAVAFRDVDHYLTKPVDMREIRKMLPPV